MTLKLGVLETARKMGLGGALLDIRNRFSHDLDVDRSIRDFELAEEEKKGEVLITLEEGFFGVYTNCILAHAFRTRGYEPIIPVWDVELYLPVPENYQEHGEKLRRLVLNREWETYLDAFGLQPFYVSDIFTPPERNIREVDGGDREYSGVKISDFAKSQTRRFIKKYTIDYDSERDRDTYRHCLRGGMDLVDFTHEILEKRDIQAVVSHHPTYLNGIFLDVARKEGIPATSVTIGYDEDTILFGRYRDDMRLPEFEDHSFLESEIERELTPGEEEAVESVMQGRVAGSSVLYHYAEETDESVDTEGNTTIAMFTNLLWDAALDTENVIFDGPYDWISTTIDAVEGMEDVHLVIKTHPAEAMRETEEEVSTELKRRYSPLPDNVTMLEPETDVNPYMLMEDADAGLVYNSTTGMEMAYFGIPVIVASGTHYRGLGFTHDPESRDEYREMVQGSDNLSMDEDMREMAKRYAHFLFNRKQVPFPFYAAGGGPKEGFELLPVKHEDVETEQFDRIVENILEDRPVLRSDQG